MRSASAAFLAIVVAILALCGSLPAQSPCGNSPGFTCSDGGVAVCQGSSWICSCGAQCPIPPPYIGGCTCGEECTGSGAWQCANCSGSPIIIDTKGEGFHLTNVANGVKFSFVAGKPEQMAWTDPAYSNGFLVLDRNGNGVVDDGKELFGNLTPQPPSKTPNGFLALAVFDRPENGGNSNGYIGPRDAVFDRLRVWIDANHDGISQRAELHTLKELGIERIDLKYRPSGYVDEFGNQFRYRGRIWDAAGGEHEICYDVFLRIASGGTGGAGTAPAQSAVIPDGSKPTVSFGQQEVTGVMEQPRVAVRSLEADGVLLLSSSDAGFLEAFRSPPRKEYAPILPYSVVIQNRSGQEIIAYSVIWDRLDPEGRVHRGRRSADAFATLAPGVGLAPNSSHVVSLLMSLESGGQTWNAGTEAQSKHLLSLWAGPSTIEISLDAVLFADGSAAGPDAAGQIPRWTARLDAEREVFTKVGARSEAEAKPLLLQLAEPGLAVARRVRGSDVEDTSVLGVMVGRTNGYDDCLALARADIALSILKELESKRLPTLDNVRRIAGSRRYPNVHRRQQ